MSFPRKIRLFLCRSDGRESSASIGMTVTDDMMRAAEDLLHMLSTGEPPPLPPGIYDLVAAAFDVPRDEAKRRMTAAVHGARGATLERLARSKP